MAWFEDWFNEDYIRIYKHRDTEEAKKILKLYEKNCGLLKDKKVLDLACGLGRLSNLLAEEALEVTAFDLSPHFIDICKKNRSRSNIEFLKMDMREMKWSRKFHVIFHIFTSFGYFDRLEDNLSIFNKVYKALKSDGIYIFDFLNSHYLRDNLCPESSEKINELEFVQKRRITNGRVEKDILISDGQTEKKYVESVQLIDDDIFDDYFRKLGFRLIAKLGNYDGDPFNKLNSERLIYILKKEWWMYELLFK